MLFSDLNMCPDKGDGLMRHTATLDLRNCLEVIRKSTFFNILGTQHHHFCRWLATLSYFFFLSEGKSKPFFYSVPNFSYVYQIWYKATHPFPSISDIGKQNCVYQQFTLKLC